MAGQLPLVQDSDGIYGSRATLFVTFACIIAATGGIVLGYDMGISGSFLIFFFFKLVCFRAQVSALKVLNEEASPPYV